MKENERKKATRELEAWKECQRQAEEPKRIPRKEKCQRGKQAEEKGAIKPPSLPRKVPPTRLPGRGMVPPVLFLFAGIGHALVY